MLVRVISEREVRMTESYGPSITEHFSILKDPRVERTKRHSLNDIVVLTVCAVICGADSWVAIEEFGKAKLSWFKTFLDLPSGIPSHDTFGRVFAALDPNEFGRCFATWLSAAAKALTGEIIAIDGKTVRRSFDKAAEAAAIHMVSAWAVKAHVVLGQVKTEAKSNEIKAIPELLKKLELSGCIVTIDAMGCQRAIVEDIVKRNADYVICLKGNQSVMHDEVRQLFDWAARDGYKNLPHDYHETVDKGHGRVETRRCWTTSETDWFQDRAKWAGLASFAMVESERSVGDETSIERRYFVSSLDGGNAKRLAEAVRGHWGIENELHWVLDVAFREDDCRVRVGFAAQNLSLVRQLALCLLKREATSKVGVKTKRMKAGWDEAYLLKVLCAAAN